MYKDFMRELLNKFTVEELNSFVQEVYPGLNPFFTYTDLSMEYGKTFNEVCRAPNKNHELYLFLTYMDFVACRVGGRTFDNVKRVFNADLEELPLMINHLDGDQVIQDPALRVIHWRLKKGK